MEIKKRYMCIVCIMFTVLALTPCAKASMIFYTSWSDFDAAAPGLPIEDFEEARITAGAVAFMDGNLDKNTSNAFFLPGEILDGLRVRENPDRVSEGIAIAGAGFAGEPSKDVFSNYFADTLDLIFYNNDVTAVGGDLHSKYVSSMFDISIYGTSGLLGTTTLYVTPEGVFGGVISTDIITRINFSSQTGQAEGVDNVAFGSPSTVPEPATMILLGSGLIGLAGYGRRKLFRK